MTDHRSTGMAAAAMLAAWFALGGCSQSSRASDSPAAPSGSETSPGSVTAAPSARLTTDRLTTEPSLTGPPSVLPVTPEPPVPTPPPAMLTVEGGDPVVGDLGSFTWRNSGSTSPWIPGAPIHIGSSEPLTLVVAQPVDVSNWTASYLAPAALRSGVPIRLGEGTREPIRFDPPPPGEWSVSVDVWFRDGLGSAAYYWLVDVD